VKIIFENEKEISFDEKENKTLLELSLQNEIPHIHACGGKARCSTCRVIIIEGLDSLDERNDLETSLAKKKGFEDNIRLACQIKPKSNLKLKRLVHDTNDIEVAISERAFTSGREEKLAILFSDIRGYTSFSETSLAYDTIHILNRYFKIMGNIVLQNFGYIDKYIGDGLMAIFGLQSDRKRMACFDAVNAGLSMLAEMKSFNQYLKKNFDVEFSIGIGIHYGPCVIGNLGHNSKMQFTAIGDTVNIASRVESQNKELDTNFLITEAVKNSLQNQIEIGKSQVAALKGKEDLLQVFELISLKQTELTVENQLRDFLFNEVSITDTPGLLRFLFHDTCTYDPFTQLGGFKAQLLKREFYSLPENMGLEKTVEKILEWSNKWTVLKNIPISKTDLIAMSISVGLEKAGLPRFPIKLGRKDAKYAEGIWDLPKEQTSNLLMQKRFHQLGMSDKEMIALLGAHTLGKANGKFFTLEPYTFDNSFFKHLIAEAKNPELALLLSDQQLLEVEKFDNIVREYANDELEFFQQFTSGLIKLLQLGQD